MHKTRYIIKRILVLSVISMLSLAFVMCSSDKDVEDEVSLEVAGNKLIRNQPDRETILNNPMTGWVMYAGLGDGLSDSFWDDYDNFESSAGTVSVSDYARVLFIRGAWSDFNPEENVYVWHEGVDTKPAKRFKILVEGAQERGLKLAFCFIVDSQDKAYNFTPDYVKNAPGIEGYETKTGSVTVWSPYPDNKVFQKYHEKFIRDFAAKYNDPDVVEFMSGTGLGKWGEYHTLKYSTKTEEPKLPVFEWITDLYAEAFNKVPSIVNYHRWMGSQTTWDGGKASPDSEGMIATAVRKGFSLRNDAYGMKTYHGAWERNIEQLYRFKRPIIAEGGWVRTSHGGSIGGDGYATYADVRQGEFNDAKIASANMMDFRYSKSPLGETASWFKDAFHLVNEFLREGGYRLYPSIVSVPENVTKGREIEIAHRWNNLGWGFCPTNIPQWKDRYKVAFALLDKTTLEPRQIFVDPTPELSACLKGSPQNYRFKVNTSNTTSGTYVWAVGIVDTTKDNKIGIQMSAKGDVTTDGWLQLVDVVVQ